MCVFERIQEMIGRWADWRLRCVKWEYLCARVSARTKADFPPPQTPRRLRPIASAPDLHPFSLLLLVVVLGFAAGGQMSAPFLGHGHP